MIPLCRSRSSDRRSTASPTSPPPPMARHTADGSASIHSRSTAISAGSNSAHRPNGKWQNGLWLNAWDVDFNYLRGNLQTRGEWLSAYRQMPAGSGPDNRQGWYFQAGYFLNGLHLPGLGEF